MVERKSTSIRVVAGVLVSIGLSWLGNIPAMAADESGIAWRENLGAAQKEARALNRPIWIQFTGPWCHFCQLMEREAFVHPPVIKHARESFVPVKLQSDDHEDLVHRLGVTGLPSTIIVTPAGVSIARQEGYIDSNSFLVFLNSSLTRSGMTARRNPPNSGSAPAVAAAP
ncbi:thioredoxin family protein, partial [Singulisphaera rosea]